jgi:hypothetical protein
MSDQDGRDTQEMTGRFKASQKFIEAARSLKQATTLRERGEALREEKRLIEQGEPEAVERHHAAGKLTARERVAALLAQEGALAAETSLEGKAGFYQAFAGVPPDAERITADLGEKFLIMDAWCVFYSFYDMGYDDPEIEALAKKADLVGGNGPGSVTIEVLRHNGTRYSIEGSEMTESEPLFENARAKFYSLASDFLDKEKMRRVCDFVRDLDKADDVGALARQLRGTITDGPRGEEQ